jgi:gliding motility-associated lipoprotein GldH
LQHAKNTYIRGSIKIMLTKRHLFILLAGVILAFCSCNKGVMYQKYTSLTDNVWDKSNPVTFTVPLDDTVNRYNVFINVRNADDFEWGNLYLFIDITAPNNATERDTLNCLLADNSGKWRGEGLGDIWDNKIPFKYNTRFHKGDYKFKITQAMRVDKLVEIMDIGLRVEQVKNN